MYDYKYSNEELENYLKLWQASKEETITVDRNLFLSLANEVLLNHVQAIEEMELSTLSERIG